MAIDGGYANYHENAGAVNNARELRRQFEKLMSGWDVRTSGALATSGTGNGGVCRHFGSATTGDMAVIQRAAGANMSVDVLAGGAMVGGTESATQGQYFVYNDASVNVPITAADGSNPRKDLIGVRVRDSEYSGVSNVGEIIVVTGTPAASPSEPTAPANFLTLALVDVAAGATSITTANITDRRRTVAALGGVIVCTSTTRPTVNLWEGMTIFERDTNQMLIYSGSAWEHVATIGAWSTYTPTFGGTSATLGNGSMTARWTKDNRTARGWITIVRGSTTNFGSTALTLTLPAAAFDPGNIAQTVGMLQMLDVGTAWYEGATYIDHNIDTGNDKMRFIVSGNNVLNTWPITWATSDILYARFEYELAA